MTARPLPPPVAPDERPAAPPFAEAAGHVFLRQAAATVRGKRALVAVLLASLPVVVTLVQRDDQSIGLVRVIVQMVLPFLVPVVAISLGSGLIYDEAEEGTLTYLVTSPVSRSSILLGKWCAALAVGWTVLLLSLSAVLLSTPVDLAPHGRFVRASYYAIAIGYPAYLGVCAFLGTLVRRGFIACLIYAFGYELILSVIPGAAKRLSVGHFLRSLVYPHSPAKEPFEGTFENFPPDSETTCLAVLLSVAIAFVAASLLIARNKEFQSRNVQG